VYTVELGRFNMWSFTTYQCAPQSWDVLVCGLLPHTSVHRRVGTF
jgi:hypothetical protein